MSGVWTRFDRDDADEWLRRLPRVRRLPRAADARDRRLLRLLFLRGPTLPVRARRHDVSRAHRLRDVATSVRSVTVSAQRDGERLRVIVEDDGVGLGAGFGNRTGIGLRNVQDRLHTLFGQASEFIIGARPGGRGTSVTLVIPLHAH